MFEIDREPHGIFNTEINLIIFEGLYGATREKLADDVCGLMRAGALYGTFKGHGNFTDEELWEDHYQGPDFCGDVARMFEVEEVLALRHWQRAYVEMLVSAACPTWQNLRMSDEVLDFWYALAHASSLQRARAASRVTFARNIMRR